MTRKRVQISTIVKNQVPSYIREEFPLVLDFLTQYYKAQEFSGAPLDLIQNIDDYIKLDELTKNIQNSVILRDFIEFNDDTIRVDLRLSPRGTEGFPDSYGLLKIDDEIITYTEKTQSSFIGCVRGFSGITTYRPEISFSESSSESHEKGTPIYNLSYLFLGELLAKIKKHFAPGFENRDIDGNINQNIFVKQVKDFYSSKGTDLSFEILFKILYGEDVAVVRPKDYLFVPSNANFRSSYDLVVESITGDVLDLENRTLYQDEYENITKAYAPIASVKKLDISTEGDFYRLKIDSGYNRDLNYKSVIYGDFETHPKTMVIGDFERGSSTIDVDSTVGFPNSGELQVNYFDGSSGTILYSGKTINQFLNCTNINALILDGSSVSLNTFAYATKEDGSLIKVRITSVLSSFENDETSYFYNDGDSLKIKTLGVSENTIATKNWILNLPVSYKLLSLSTQNISEGKYVLETDKENIFGIGDILILERNDFSLFECEVLDKTSNKKLIIKSSSTLDITAKYTVRRKLLKSKLSNFQNVSEYNTNVQNIYVDKEKVLVSAPSIPSYKNEVLQTNSGKITFSGTFVGELFRITNFYDHGFYTGDAVYYTPEKILNPVLDFFGQETGEFVEEVLSQLFNEGLYFVQRVDENTIRLAKSLPDIKNSKFISVSQSTVNSNTLTPYNFRFSSLENQKLLREISPPINDGNVYETPIGKTGILINGVEILNYKSTDSISYGGIEEIIVSSSGSGYDIINPPQVIIEDENGSEASAYCAVSGSLERIDLIEPGFDFIEDPIVTITGGNGVGAKVEVKTKLVENDALFYSDTNVGLGTSVSTIGFTTYHRFKQGEAVIYKTYSQKAVSGLSTNSVYYVSIQDQFKVKLHGSRDAAISGINTITILSPGYGIHSLQSVNKRKVIDSLNVIDSGTGYQNKKRTCRSVGVNTSSNEITIKSHDFESGEIVKYYNTTTPIGGLSANTEYYVHKIDDDRFRLSFIATGNLDKDFYYREKQYINLTSTGDGVNIFNYPEIRVEVVGKTGISTENIGKWEAKINPVFRGSITSVHLESIGRDYGNPEILNYKKQPNIRLSSGFGAQVKPIVVNGRISEVIILKTGKDYYETPDLVITSEGFGAVLVPIVENGKLVSVKVTNGGFGYSQESTIVDVLYAGSDFSCFAKVQSWNVNLVAKNINRFFKDDGFITKSSFGLEYTHLYAPRNLRESVYKIDSSGSTLYSKPDLEKNGSVEVLSKEHSPILGWAYDGNPIYGPYGYSSKTGGSITQIKSGYKIKLRENRPPISLYREGFFLEDFTYYKSKDESILDEHNGRFCVTPDFPNGIYAYFATINEGESDSTGTFAKYKSPTFPYFIGNSYKSKPNQFNFDSRSNQDETDLNNTLWKRNTYYYNIKDGNDYYRYIYQPNNLNQTLTVRKALTGSIENIIVKDPGSNYKVNDLIVFSDKNKYKKVTGLSASARVSRIKGKDVNSISVASTFISNVEIYPAEEGTGRYVLYSNEPHNLIDSSPIILSGLNKSTNFAGSYYVGVSSSKFVLVGYANTNIGIHTIGVTGIVTDISVRGDFKNIRENDIIQINQEKLKILNIDEENLTLRVLRSIDGSISTSHTKYSEIYEVPRKLLLKSNKKLNLPSKINKEFYFDPHSSVGLGTTSGVGITSSIFFESIQDQSPIGVGTGVQTVVYFKAQKDYFKYSSGGYVDIVNASDSNFDANNLKVVSVGQTTITLDYDTTTLSGVGVTAYLNKKNALEIPTKTIYIKNHGLVSGDTLTYAPNGGDSIGVSTDGIDTFSLNSVSKLYVTRVTDDLIGISSVKTGIGSTGIISGVSSDTRSQSTLYFTGIGTGVIHSFKTEYESIKGNIEVNTVNVSLAQTHGMKIGDGVYIDVNPSLATTIKVKYNDHNRVITFNSKQFTSVGVNTVSNTITIENHGFNTGQKVLHTSISPSGGLQNNSFYYVVFSDKDTIKLASSMYAAKKEDPEILNITSSSFGELSLVNPPITIYKDCLLTFDLTDSSLSYESQSSVYPAFDMQFYVDEDKNKSIEFSKDFKISNIKKIGIVGISTNASVSILVDEETPAELYYKFVPVYETEYLPKEKKGIIIDDTVEFANSIILLKSIYNGRYNIVSAGITSFSYLIPRYPERDLYISKNSIIKYDTDSLNESGGISKTIIESNGFSYSSPPDISTILSKNGSGATLEIESKSIGKIKSVKIEDIGFNFPSDNTIRPSMTLPQVIKVDSLSSISSIGVKYSGKNYSTPPKLIVLDPITNEVYSDIELKYEKGSTTVDIVSNTFGIKDVAPKILPIENSNGVGISTLVYNQNTNEVVVILSEGFSTIEDFPFEINDKVLIENVSVGIATTGKGYNSDNHKYSLFTLSSVDKNVGGIGSVTYSLDGFIKEGEVPGRFDPINSVGRIIPEKHFPTFNIKLQTNDYIKGEMVVTNTGKVGVVDSWNENNKYLKVISDEKILPNETITGKISKTKSTATSVHHFESFLSLNAYALVKENWIDNKGFLNENQQRLQDNLYYQNFSYSLKSKVSYDTWSDAVSTLNHTLGFKKFSDYQLESTTSDPISETFAQNQEFLNSSIETINDITGFVDLNCVNDFDLVTENSLSIFDREFSNRIIFKSKELTDYIESIGNRVLLIDDLSPEFNSNPRFTTFGEVYRFNLDQVRSQKSLVYVKDSRYNNQRQILNLTLIHDGFLGYVNQYARVESVYDLGSFEFSILGTEGILSFYPTEYKINDYDISYITFSLDDNLLGVGTVNIGPALIDSSSVVVSTGVTSNIVSIGSSYSSIKVLVQIQGENNEYEFDELNIVNNGSGIKILEYGQLTTNVGPLSISGFGTYSAYISGSTFNLDFIPNPGIAATINTIRISLGNTESSGTSAIDISQGRLESRTTSIPASPSPTENVIGLYPDEFDGAYYIVQVYDITNNECQLSEVSVLDIDENETYSVEYGIVETLSGLGTIGTRRVNAVTELVFTPYPNIEVQTKVFMNAIRQSSNPKDSVSFNNYSIVSGNSKYFGSESDVKREFYLRYKGLPIFERYFDSEDSTIVNLSDNTITIPNHFFVTGEKLTYSHPGAGTTQAIEIQPTTFPGIGLTDKLPSEVYAIKIDDNIIKLASSAEDSLSLDEVSISFSGVGIGSHKIVGNNQNTRSIITIDNVIQTPVVATSATTGLIRSITTLDNILYFGNPTQFFNGDLIKVDDEIMLINSIGIGSTNAVSVKRPWMGTTISGHPTDSLVSRLRGNYNIVDNVINFVSAPYGNSLLSTTTNSPNERDWLGISGSSQFQGRVFIRSGVPNSDEETYSKNYVYDDISYDFDGIEDSFSLKVSGNNVSGIGSDRAVFMLINNIFQEPGQSLDYIVNSDNISGVTTITFNGNQIYNENDINGSGLPLGGIINSVGSFGGFGYQPLVSAGGTCIISVGGTIQSISIGNTGSGYRSSKYYEILTEVSNSVGVGSTEIYLKNENSVFEILNLLDTGSNCIIGIGSIILPTPITSIGNTSVNIGIGSTGEYIIQENTSVSILIQNPSIGVVNIRSFQDSFGGISTTKHVGFATIVDGSISTNIIITNPGSGYISANPPYLIFDSPLSYSNIPLIYGNGTSGIGTRATIDIVVGQGSSVINFELKNLGYGYKEGDILTVPSGGLLGIPTTAGYSEFNIFVDKVDRDSFSAWSIGQLQVIDKIDELFDGSKTSFDLRIANQLISIKSSSGSNINTEDALLVFINNVLQVPGESYIFEGGSIIRFTEPPKPGVSCKILFYRGTPGIDAADRDILETIKIGDELTISNSYYLDQDPSISQDSRETILIEGVNIIKTNPYFGRYVNQNEDFLRPIMWCRQTEDKIINGKIVGKNRDLYEPSIYPSSYAINEVGVGTNVVFVDNIIPFFNQKNENDIDVSFQNFITFISQEEKISVAATAIVSTSGTISSINIEDGGRGYIYAPEISLQIPSVGTGHIRATASASITSGIVTDIVITNPGFGYTQTNPPLVLVEPPTYNIETKLVSLYEGDSGLIVGISTTSVGTAHTAIDFDLYIPENSFLRDSSIVSGITTVSGIQTGYYFAINSSTVGYGITSLSTNGDIIGISTSFLDTVYQAFAVSIAQTSVPGIGVTYVNRVTVSVVDYNGLESGLSGIGNSDYYGQFSWGRIIFSSSSDYIYPANTLNGYSGISTGTIISRTNPLKYSNYIP